MSESALRLPDLEPGWVWLVGAGPGDPGLLTLYARHALGQADVVVYDALVSEAALALARTGAVLEFAGKRGGRPEQGQQHRQREDPSPALSVGGQHVSRPSPWQVSAGSSSS